MAVEVGQLGPAADVGGLVEHDDQRDGQPAAGCAFGVLLGGVGDRDRQAGDQRAGRALALLGEAVERAGAACTNSCASNSTRSRPGVTQASAWRLVRKAEDLLGGPVDAAALLVGRVDLGGQRGAEQPVVVLAQDADRLVVAGVGDPQVGLLDRAAGERGGQQQRGDDLLALGVKERVGARLRVVVGGGEDVGEVGGLDLVGDIRERVPPPARGLVDQPLRVEDPHRPDGGARAARRVDGVALVRRRHDRAGRLQDRRDHAAGGLAGPRPGDVQRAVLPALIQRAAPGHRPREGQAGRLDAEPLGGRGGAAALERREVAAAAHVRGRAVDPPTAPAAAPPQQHDAGRQRAREQEQAEQHERGVARPREPAARQLRRAA